MIIILKIYCKLETIIDVVVILLGFTWISKFFELHRGISGWVIWELQNLFKKFET